MKLFKLLAQFFLIGVDVFCEASRGEYNREVKDFTEFRNKLFSNQKV